MAETEKDKHKAAARIQSIQRGKAAREEKRQKDQAAAKIQSIQRGKTTRLEMEQKMKEEAEKILSKSGGTLSEKGPDEPQSDDFNNTTGTNFGADTRKTDFGETGGCEIRGGETINNTHIEKFCTFTKKDGHFTGLYPETTDALLSSPRPPSRLEAAQEDLIVNNGQKQHKSVHSNYKFFKWYARKSNAVSTLICLPFSRPVYCYACKC